MWNNYCYTDSHGGAWNLREKKKTQKLSFHKENIHTNTNKQNNQKTTIPVVGNDYICAPLLVEKFIRIMLKSAHLISSFYSNIYMKAVCKFITSS